MSPHDNPRYVKEQERDAALAELVAQMMWHARYRKYKWDDVAGDDAYDRRSKKAGFRRTALAAIKGLADLHYEISYVGPGSDPLLEDFDV